MKDVSERVNVNVRRGTGMRLYHTSDRVIREPMQLVWKDSYTLYEAAMETARMNYDAAKERFDSEFGAALDRMDIE